MANDERSLTDYLKDLSALAFLLNDQLGVHEDEFMPDDVEGQVAYLHSRVALLSEHLGKLSREANHWNMPRAMDELGVLLFVLLSIVESYGSLGKEGLDQVIRINRNLDILKLYTNPSTTVVGRM